MHPPLIVPDEWRFYFTGVIHIPHIAGERRHIVGRVGEFQHGLTDDLAGGFLSQLRHDLVGKTRATPAIILTGEASTALVTQASELGCDSFLLKPVSPQKLKARIDAIFKGEQIQSSEASPKE